MRITDPLASGKPSEPITLLLLSGGSLVGQNIIQALAARRQHVRLLANNSAADEPSLADFDEVRLAPVTADAPEALERQLLAWIEECRPNLVIPCRDDDVSFLAHLAARHPTLAPLACCGTPEIAEVMLDKLASARFSDAHALPFAATILPDDRSALSDFATHHGFPLIAKPRQGFASRKVTILLDEQHLDAVLGHTDMIVQQYLSDPSAPATLLDHSLRFGVPLFHSLESVKISLQAFIGANGQTTGVFVTRHRMRQGVSALVERDDDPAAHALALKCAAVFAREGWRGPLNIQCQPDRDGTLRIYEYNGRFTGATAARTAMGYDEIGLALSALTGRSLLPPAAAAVTRVTKQPFNRPDQPAIRDALLADGRWQAQADSVNA